MSQVDYEQKIREIKKLKISAEEKSRRICALTYKAKAKPVVVERTLHEQIRDIQENSSLSAEEKYSTIKALVDKIPQTVYVPCEDIHAELRAQINRVEEDSSLSRCQKDSKIKALVAEKI